MPVSALEKSYYEAECSRAVRALAALQSVEGAQGVPPALLALRPLLERRPQSFPEPRDLWIVSKFDGPAELDCFGFLAPVRGKVVGQIGGSGLSAIEFALAEAAESWLIAPLQCELDLGCEMARVCGVTIHPKLGVAEEMPFADDYFDGLYAPGCAHHFDTEKAFAEISRVLRPGGRLAAMEPWKAPWYSAGVRVFGKREPIDCKPLDDARMVPFFGAFPGGQIIHHGALTRYFLIALERLGAAVPRGLAWRVLHFDDKLTPLPWRRYGSSVAIMGSKPAHAKP